MSTGVNNTVRWTLEDGTLTFTAVNGVSGVARSDDSFNRNLLQFCTGMTDSEYDSVKNIIFSDSVAFERKDFVSSSYERIAPWYPKQSIGQGVNNNIESINVSGLNTTGVKDFTYVFGRLPMLTTIVGLNNLDTSYAECYDYMFRNTSLSVVDISGFDNLDVSTISIVGMFLENPYLQTIILPTNFNLDQANESYSDEYKYSFGIAKGVQARKGTVAVNSDEDFFKLTETSQGGTWTRDISGIAELKFNVQRVSRDGNSAEMVYSYYSNSATVEVYIKDVSQASFPVTPYTTFNIQGTGSGVLTLNLTSDNAYDVMVKVYDGETTLYVYPSIDSNVLLFSVDEDGNVSASGDIEDGSGNVLASKLDSSGIFDLIYPVGSYYWTSDSNFSPANTFGGTWEKIDAGVTLVSAGTGYTVQSGTAKDGGNDEITLTDKQMAHGHTYTRPTVVSGEGGHTHTVNMKYTSNATPTGTGQSQPRANGTSTSSGFASIPANSGTHNHTLTGGGVADLAGASSTREAFDNMPPYKAAYCWHRTA